MTNINRCCVDYRILQVYLPKRASMQARMATWLLCAYQYVASAYIKSLKFIAMIPTGLEEAAGCPW